ncbi:MAG: exodeoxyribonuclease VII large subunit [Anaerovoracaceae bacterium]|nr:exodeoxyribonuclease VII large subunit [Anaerovoracaceae bacterium]
MALKPVTVTQLNEYISRVLGTDPLLSNITVTGEISNLKHHSSGHIYFSISDASSKINCFLPATYARNLAYELGDGINVIIRGYVNVYKKGGTYTLFVRELEAAGEGDLSMAFELLKSKLRDEGLFDAAHKRPIPAFPRKIAIITSPTGAAVRDMIKIITGRTSMTDVTIFPAQVQGTGAAAEMAEVLDFVNENFPDTDTVIIGRGGGSAEDLWAFNEEVLARAIYRSKIPVISAVGHETDFSISDFVADMRAETPTAAAEKAVPDDGQLKNQILTYMTGLMTDLKNRVDLSELRREKYIQNMRMALIKRIDDYEHSLLQSYITLDENNPVRILNKGYAYIENTRGQVVSSAGSVTEGSRYRIFFKDGSIEATFNDIKEGDGIDF